MSAAAPMDDTEATENGSAAVSASAADASATTKLFALFGARPEAPCVVLGHHYPGASAAFVAHVGSLVWLTYRCGFEPIARAADGPHPLAFLQLMVFNRNVGSTLATMGRLADTENFTTDVGWGCMIRTSQALLANALARVSGADVIALFTDTAQAPFLLHNFVRVARQLPLGVKPGEWFGPTAASLSIKRLCEASEVSVGAAECAGAGAGRAGAGRADLQHTAAKMDVATEAAEDATAAAVPRLRVLVSESSDLYHRQIRPLLTAPLLILLPIRLGIDNINPYYHPSLFHLLSLTQSVGIAGGKPSSSYYFFGYEGTRLLYLDPHYPQLSSGPYHTTRYLALEVGQMDPSMLVGFLVRDEAEYNHFVAALDLFGNKIVTVHEETPDTDVGSGYSLLEEEGEEDAMGYVDLGDGRDEAPETVGVEEVAEARDAEAKARAVDDVVAVEREEASVP